MGEAERFCDPAWRLANLYYIVDKQARRIHFKQNSVQRAISASPAHRKIILKARQFGVSTGEILKQFDHVIWNNNVTACILAHEKDAIEKLFRICRRAYDFSDKRFKPEIDRGGGSKYEMFFPKNNSRIYCDLESRSDTIHWLHISEAAFVDDPMRLMATIQAVPAGGTITIESTPNGVGNWFYDLWQKGDTFAKLFFPWFCFEPYAIEAPQLDPTDEEIEFMARTFDTFGIQISNNQLMFRRSKQDELGQLFAQEYPEDDMSCFLSSGNAAIDLVKLKKMLDGADTETRANDDDIFVFEKPCAEGIYVIGADCSEGVQGDNATACVIEVASMRQVAALAGQYKPSAFAHKLDALGRLYTARAVAPIIGVERNNHGHAVLLELNEHIGYPNLFSAKDERVGWLTDKITRPIMMDNFVDAIEHGHLLLVDPETLKECLTLVNNKGKIEAQSGKKDDRVLASAIALQMALDYKRSGAGYENIRERILL